MKKFLAIFFSVFISINCFSQVEFEPGYFINNSSEKIECLIKNTDPVHNPSGISYKTSENSESISLSVSDIREFGIYNFSKYVRFAVKIDRSSHEISHLSDHGAPDFETDTLLLKCLIEGKASLYKYSEPKEKLLRFFYALSDENAQQLIYKMYKTKATEIAINNNFRNQIKANIYCESFANFPYKKLMYKSTPLVNYFIKYNTCVDGKYTDFYKSVQKREINLNVRPGITFATMSITSYNPVTTEYELSSKAGFRFGLELEYILPFNKNKWAMIFEPTFQNYKGEAETIEGSIKADFNYLEFPVGLRYSIFLNEHLKIFLNTQYCFDAILDSDITFEYREDIQVDNTASIIFGTGVQYKRYIIELRGCINRNSLYRYTMWNSKYGYLSLVVGFNLL